MFFDIFMQMYADQFTFNTQKKKISANMVYKHL